MMTRAFSMLTPLLVFSLVALTGCPLMPPVDPSTQPAWLDSLDDAIAEATASDKKIIFFAHLDTCPTCNTMFRYTWADEAVRAAAGNFVMLSIEGREDPDVFTAYGITRVPRTFVLQSDGSVIEEYQGHQYPDEMLAILNSAME